MQAVVLAGGKGTRLRPLTHHRPKALLPLVNKPILLHVLERLPASVDEVIVAAGYRTEDLRAFFRRTDVGRRVVIVRERRALGTGGALKNLEERLGDTVLAINGDIVCSLGIADFLAAHRRFGGVATIALWEVDDPTGFGVAKLAGDRITRFVEKPPKARAPSRWANAGIYALEREVLERIPGNRRVSLEREVFPTLVRKGLYGHRFGGYWADVGTPAHFLHASALLMREFGSEASRQARIGTEATLVKPFSVAARALVNGRVGPAAVVGRGCRVGRARVRNSVLFDRVEVGDGARVEGSLVGEGSRIGPRAVVVDALLADDVRIRADQEIVGRKVAS